MSCGARFRRRCGGHRAGGGGGGGCGVVLANVADDNFDCGSSIDTAGTRFSGANPWTLWNPDVGFSGGSLSGGQLVMPLDTYGNLWAPHGAYQSLPGGSGDWVYETDCGLLTYDFATAAGLVLLETSTGKHFCPCWGYSAADGGALILAAGPSTLGQYGGVAGGSMAGKLEVARISGNLRMRYDIGAGWVTLVASLAQTTPFTTAPDKVGVFHAPQRVALGSDTSYHNYFYRTA